ncbi:13569_t:CDS:2 [Entrophospora sp. SA101]|nr:13569_t:CDS:2 [Entrophospora sp. SA101]
MTISEQTRRTIGETTRDPSTKYPIQFYKDSQPQPTLNPSIVSYPYGYRLNSTKGYAIDRIKIQSLTIEI